MRAHNIEMIYNLAAPLIGEINNDVADEFLINFVELVKKRLREW